MIYAGKIGSLGTRLLTMRPSPGTGGRTAYLVEERQAPFCARRGPQGMFVASNFWRRDPCVQSFR